MTHGKSPVVFERAVQDRYPCFAAKRGILVMARCPLRVCDLNRQVKQVASQEQRRWAIGQDHAPVAWRMAGSVDQAHTLHDLAIIGTEVEPALFL